MDMGDGGIFTITSGPEEDAKEIAELTVFPEDLTDEEIMQLAGTLSALAKMMLVELGVLEEEDLDDRFKIDNKSKLH